VVATHRSEVYVNASRIAVLRYQGADVFQYARRPFTEGCSVCDKIGIECAIDYGAVCALIVDDARYDHLDRTWDVVDAADAR